MKTETDYNHKNFSLGQEHIYILTRPKQGTVSDVAFTSMRFETKVGQEVSERSVLDFVFIPFYHAGADRLLSLYNV